MWMTTTGIIAAASGAATIFLRRRISKNWIDYRNRGPADLDGQVIIITGANTGLGFESAKDFARRNGTVILACRNMEIAQEAANSIIQNTGNDKVKCMEVDLGSLDSVKKFASNVTEQYPSLYALVCNAGVCMPMDEQHKTKDGFEAHFGVNHLGHFALVKSIVDDEQFMNQKKSKEEEFRVVWVSSGLMKSGKIDMQKQDFVYDGRVKNESEKGFMPTGYADSKLMNGMTCRHLASTMEQKSFSHVTTYTVCPGFCRSSLGRYMNMPLSKKIMFAPIMRLLQRTSAQGAQNIIFATLEDRNKLKSGAMYRDGDLFEGNEQLDDLGKDILTGLWDLSEKLLAEKEY